MIKTGKFSHVCRKGIFLYDRFRSQTRYVCCISIFLLLIGPREQLQKQHSATDTSLQHDLFKDKAVIKYSRGFTLEYHGNYKLLNILNRFADKAEPDTLKYVLVQKGTPPPSMISGAQVIEIPVQKMVVTSSMHVGMLDFAGSTDVLTGMADFKYVTSPTVRKKMAAGNIVEVGLGSNMNDEMIISMRPGVVMTMGSAVAKFSRFKTLSMAHIPVLINSEWLETDPLGRSEWVKMMAALLNKEALVNEKFNRIEQEYNRLKKLTAKVAFRPTVVGGMPFKGSWFVSDGDSYITKFLIDAGANYKWSNVKGTGSLALDFETVAPVALTADFWLNPGSANTKGDIAAKDKRYTQFRPFRNGTIYNNNKRVNELGANDYWESGSVNPHTILADLIKILHPEVLPGHELVYYKQIK